MSITTKTCWPELVGKTADEAVQVIKEESGKTNQKFFEILFDSFRFIKSSSMWTRFKNNT